MKTTFAVALFSSAALVMAQQPSNGAANAAEPSGLPHLKSMIPKLDAKTVQAANTQQSSSGITDVCSQSLARVASDWKTAQDSVNALVNASNGQAVLPAAQAAQKAMQTEAAILNSKAGTKIDSAGITSYENAGVAIGQAMGAVSQIRQIQGQPAALNSAADKATLDLQSLRTSQFATFGACGASVGATIDASDAAKAPGIPGAQTKVLCQVPSQLASR